MEVDHSAQSGKIRGKKRKFRSFQEGRTSSSTTIDSVAQFLEKKKSQSPDAAEWQTVKSKKHKKKDRYPSLGYSDLHRLQSYVKLADLQSLVLYCLADAPAPQFVSLQKHNNVERVVVLLVPGLEKEMFERGRSLDLPASASFAPSAAEERTSATEEAREVRNNARSNHTTAYRGPQPDDYLPTKLPVPDSASVLQPLADIFEHVWPVKSPGEDFQVHSPLQAMLQAQIPKTRAEKDYEKKHKGAKPVHGNQRWENKRTNVAEYLLSVEEMIDNDFVLSPLHYEEGQVDQETEMVKRQSRKQTQEHGWLDLDPSKSEGRDLDAIGENEVDAEARIRRLELTGGRQVLAIDCEMCLVQGGTSALTRISIVDWTGLKVLDEYVRPDEPIIDYLTP